MDNCISVDWLQLHVAMPHRDFDTLVKSDLYDITREAMQTRNFKVLYTIRQKVPPGSNEVGQEVAVIAAEPRNEMCMKEDSALIKIANKFLYQKNFSGFARSILKELQLRFINITRIDLAYDFLKFDTMECPDFINRVASRYYLKARSCKFKMMGDTWSVEKGQITGGISSLKFGLETSDVSYYLYNKSLELRQVKHKPWICENWEANGWDGKQDVYRLEFSLRPDTNGIQVVNEHGELQQVYHFKDLSMLDGIDDVYRHYFDKHFNFVKTEKTKAGNYKKQSRCKPVKLFNFMPFASVKIVLSTMKDSTRSTKIFAKRLMQLNQELRGQDFDLAIMGNEMMTWIITTRNLEEWADKKLPGYHLSERVLHLVEQGKNINTRLQHEKIAKHPTCTKNADQQAIDLRQTEWEVRLKNMPKVYSPAPTCKGCGNEKHNCGCPF